MTRVLVTGAGGYVGGRLVAALSGDPAVTVRAHVRRPTPWLDGLAEVVAADLAGPDGEEAARAACDGVDTVVHLAGPNEIRTAADPDGALAETLLVARRVAAGAAAAGVGRIVCLSTIHVYGDRAVAGAVLTEDTVPAPRSVYAVARLAAEHLVAVAAPDSALVVLRLTNSVGAPLAPEVDRWTLVANDLCRQAVTTGRLVLRTHGLQCRDFVSLADAARIVAASARADMVPPGTYNLGSGVPSTVRDLVVLVQDSVESVTGRRPSLVAPPAPATTPGTHRVDIARLAALGLAPTILLADAVEETVRFCAAHRDTLTGEAA